MQPSTTPRPSHRVRNAILWFSSWLVILVAVALLQFIIHLVAQGTGATNSLVKIVNILSILAGVVAVLFIPIGIVMGTLTLTKRS